MKKNTNYYKAMEIMLDLYENSKSMKPKQKMKKHENYIRLVKKSAYRGNVDAQFELALNYEDQNFFIPNPMFNIKKRFYWYSKAANGNHPEACNNLASLYEKGEGTKKNIKKAMFFYRKAYKLGCAYARDNYELLKKQHNGK